jgi:zinc protease
MNGKLISSFAESERSSVSVELSMLYNTFLTEALFGQQRTHSMKLSTSSTLMAGLFAVALNCTQLSAKAQSFDVKTAMLKNGMKVLVQEDHSLPQVALYIFYKIGSRNERVGTTGISHFFEHMMFNGAKKYGAGEFDRVMEAKGGSNNASTSQDLTVYHEIFPPATLETIFDLEADRIENLAFDPKVIASERGVVASERRTSIDNNNSGILREQLYASAYTAHPYHWPVVGWMSDIENWKMDDLKNHFKMGYSPSNATMVVVGDVTQDQVMNLARKYIEPIPSHAPPAPVTTKEPKQLGERRVEVKKFAQLPIVMMGYHVPEATNSDYYVLKLLSAILTEGESSRFYKRLVDKDQLALSVGGYMPMNFDPSLYNISVRLKEGASPKNAEKAIYEELDKIKTVGISDEELEKARNLMLMEFYEDMKTQEGKAQAIGRYEVYFGDYRKLFDAADAFKKITKDEIKRAAIEYFIDTNRTVSTLVPDKNKQAESSSKAQGGKVNE